MHSAKLACRTDPGQGSGAGILKASGGNVDRALQCYNRERLPDIKALLALNQLWAARMGIRAEVGASWHACTRSTCQLDSIEQLTGYAGEAAMRQQLSCRGSCAAACVPGWHMLSHVRPAVHVLEQRCVHEWHMLNHFRPAIQVLEQSLAAAPSIVQRGPMSALSARPAHACWHRHSMI